MTLSGRVALVTGASQGIGHACALRLAQSGATLALAARNQEKLHELASQIEAAGERLQRSRWTSATRNKSNPPSRPSSPSSARSISW